MVGTWSMNMCFFMMPSRVAKQLQQFHASPVLHAPRLLFSTFFVFYFAGPGGQIAILMGCAVLPHLRQMVEIVEHGLVDEQQKVCSRVCVCVCVCMHT